MSQSGLKITAVGETYADICQSVEAMCQEFPAKYWRDLEDAPIEACYPEAFVKTMEEAGFLSPMIPEDYGGIALPMGGAAKIVETIHACGSNGATFIAQNRLAALLATCASDAQKERLLPAIAAGEVRLQSLALADGSASAEAAPAETRAEKTAGGYVLHGRKKWVRFADGSDLMLATARTGDRQDDASLFLVDLRVHWGGAVRVEPVESMNNVSASEILLDGLEVSEDDVIGPLGKARACLESSEAVEAILGSAAAIGDSAFFCKKGVDYANERVVFGNPIGKYQGIQFPLARTYVETRGAEMLLHLAIALYEAGEECRDEAIMAWHMTAAAAWETADAAFTTHGGFAFAREYDVERKWREVRAIRNQVANALPHLAEHVLRLPPG